MESSTSASLAVERPSSFLTSVSFCIDCMLSLLDRRAAAVLAVSLSRAWYLMITLSSTSFTTARSAEPKR